MFVIKCDMYIRWRAIEEKIFSLLNQQIALYAYIIYFKWCCMYFLLLDGLQRYYVL